MEFFNALAWGVGTLALIWFAIQIAVFLIAALGVALRRD
jgi:hypothetical protein